MENIHPWTITDRKNWYLHIDSIHPEHGEKHFFCDYCEKGFIFNCNLKTHLIRHGLLLVMDSQVMKFYFYDCPTRRIPLSY